MNFEGAVFCKYDLLTRGVSILPDAGRVVCGRFVILLFPISAIVPVTLKLPSVGIR